MLAELSSSLELFLQQKIQLLPRGHTLIPDVAGGIPPSWEQALSPNEAVAYSIERLWQPVDTEAIQTIGLLTKRIEELALVVSPVSLSPLGLLYIFRRRHTTEEHFNSWLGGLPATKGDIALNELRLGCRISRSYAAFTQVHNGFLSDGWSSLGLRPLGSLYFLSELTEESEVLNYEPGQMLAFCGDGAGNEQCFHLNKPVGEGDYLTFDWDHEVREVSKPQPFWPFLAQFIAKEMRE